MPLSLPSNNIDRHNSTYQSKFSKRTIENTGLLSLGRPPKQPLPPTPASPSQPPSHSKYIKRRTRQKERELIEIKKISLQEPPKGSLTLPKFQWIRGTMIGKGSQGKVYIAINATTGEIMAVKQVERPKPSTDGLKRIANALREEQETLRHLNHPNIVQYLGFEENHQTLNIFLEYVSGGTIESCVKDFGRLREDVAKFFTRQILGGLAYLHSEGILHRDLKAANILVMDSGDCKISDFGISKRNLRAFSFAGTAHCMAPETLSPGLNGYDSKVDIWSVGCVVQQMWTAMRTWKNVDFITILRRLSEGQLPPLPHDVSLSMLALHFRQECFQINPDHRPSAAFLLYHPYLELSTDWEFPGMRAIGCVPNAAYTTRRDNRRPTPDAHYASTFQDMQIAALALALPSHETPANRSSEVLPMEHPSTRPLPSPPSYSTNPRPLPSPPPSPAPSHLRSGGSSSSIASVSTVGILANSCDPPQGHPLKIPTIPESEDTDTQITSSKSLRTALKSPPFRYTPPPLPDPQFPYSSHLLPPTKYFDAKTRYPDLHLRKTESNPEISIFRSQGLTVPRQQRANSTGVTNSTAEAKAKNPTRSRWSKPLPTPPSPTLSPASPLARLLDQTAIRPLPFPTVSTSLFPVDDTILSNLSRSGSTWQKPPAAILIRPRAEAEERASGAVPPLPNSSPCTNATTRPGIREVVEKLEDYFPEHNLDAPVVMEHTDSPLLDAFDLELCEGMGIYDPAEMEIVARRISIGTRRSRKPTMKSIKSIAEENVLDQLEDSSLARRQTKCWDSQVEEIKVPW